MFTLARLRLPTCHSPTPIASIRDITTTEKTTSKTRGIQLANGINYTAYTVSLAWPC